MGGWCRVCVGLAAATAAAVAGACGCAQVSPGATDDDRVGGAGATSDGGAPGGGKGDGSGCGPLDTLANCGACGHACLAAGGTTRCVASGASWVCQPSCDATHGDCDGNPANGCESTLDTSANCGACGRACSTTGASSTSCRAGVCAPVCATARSDCSRPAAPTPDDGCETDATSDPGEFDNRCSGAAGITVPEGQRQTVSGNRILPIGDLDTLHVHLIEASHDCVPLAGQSYVMRIDLTPPPGVDLRLAYNLNACDDSWSLGFTTAICVSWSGTCIANDDRDFWFQVYGSGSSNSCLPYTINVQYANEGESIPGCN